MNSGPPSRDDANPDVEYFQQLADGAPVMIWMSGCDMGCFYFNRAWLDFRGRTTEQEFGNGWAEGVHPDDLERCVQHYIGSFERRGSFAMSYRLQHHSGGYRWILDRGAPHYASDGEFLGFYGGCAELADEAGVARIDGLREVLRQIQDFADRVAAREIGAHVQHAQEMETLRSKTGRLRQEYLARQNAASRIGQLAADMITYDQIAKGACIH